MIGRYVQSDPIGLLGGNNLYLYSEADPVNKIDPTGQKQLTVTFGGNAIIGSYGGSLETGFGFDSSGNLCVLVNYCTPQQSMMKIIEGDGASKSSNEYGWPALFLGLGGTIGIGSDDFCPGYSTAYSNQVTADFGKGRGGAISATADEIGQPNGVGKGFLGVGVGGGDKQSKL